MMGGPGGDGEQPEFIRGLMGRRDMGIDPRKETFLQMLYQTFCPTLTWSSFITMVTLFECAVFLVVTCISFATGLNQNYLLGASRAVIDPLDRFPYKIVNKYQIYRLATAVCLHTGFNHWI